MRIYEALGIPKVEIEKRQAWQSYIESNFNAQRRLADWHFEKAQTLEDLLAAHEKWLLDFNYQHHFAHEKREDGCHSVTRRIVLPPWEWNPSTRGWQNYSSKK